MAKILIENTREHDITLNAAGAEGVVQVTVPGARQDANDKNKLVYGVAEADDALVEEAKKSPVVAHYFKEGWLRLPKAASKGAKE